MGSEDFFKRGKIEKHKREEKVRELRAMTWLVICEGEKTEPNYFRQLIERFNREGKRKIKYEIAGFGRNTIGLVKSCEEYFDYVDRVRGKCTKIIPYEKIIFVFDKDDFSDAAFNDAVVSAKNRYKDAVVAWSNESFELWAVLHFKPVTARHTGKDYNDMLTGIFRKKGIYTKYENYEKNGKNDENLLVNIENCDGSIQNAVKNAEQILKDEATQKLAKTSPAKANPVTMVYKAVKALAKDTGYDL